MMHEFLGIHMWWWLLWLVFIIAAIYFLFTNINKDFSNKKTAKEILKERYAKGEISREEFLEKINDLNNK